MRRLLRSLCRDDGGTALVEASLVIPFTIILMVGLIDFGRAYFTQATAQKSMRNAVRYLTTLPPASICGWGLTKARNLALHGDVESNGKQLVKDWKADEIRITAPDCSKPVSAASVIRMEADVPFEPIVWPVIGLPSTINLKVDYEARWIGG